MRKALYYLSWAVIIGFLSIIAIGIFGSQGIGPLILAVVVTAAVFGIITLND